MEINNSKNPLISIITVVFNAEEFLEETILSILNQDYKNIEFIIIDGKSTDLTLDVIKKYHDKIDILVSEEDKGIYDAMNKGIGLANGEWLNFLNAGDLFFGNDVLTKVFEKKRTDAAFLYGKVDYYSIENGSNQTLGKKVSIRDFQTSFPICHQSMFFNKEIFNYFGRYDLNYKVTADYDLVIKIFKDRAVKKVYIDSVISKFLIDGFGFNNSFQGHWERVKIADNHFNFFIRIISRFRFLLTSFRLIVISILKILRVHNLYSFIRYKLILKYYND